MTPDELDRYFADTHLKCLECGKRYRGLDQHVYAAHGITADEYRQVHDIPKGCGLIGSELRRSPTSILQDRWRNRPEPTEWQGAIAGIEDVDAYLGGEDIECLLCGHAFGSLQNHLPLQHGITADDYRDAFGIPADRPLHTQARAAVRA